MYENYFEMGTLQLRIVLLKRRGKPQIVLSDKFQGWRKSAAFFFFCLCHLSQLFENDAVVKELNVGFKL